MLKEDSINQFFVDIKHILSDSPFISTNGSKRSNIEGKPKLTKQVNDKEGSQRTNVIYLNTDCNLRCEYCYEGNSREGLPDQANVTLDGIDEFLQEIVDREKDLISTVVIMGGEPFLRFDLVQYIVAKSMAFPDKRWGISIITNATLFTPNVLDKLKYLMDLCENVKRTHLSLEVSYDGVGQHRRKWPDGSSSEPQVLKGIDRLVECEIPFKVSYTVQKDNCDNVIEDAIRIFERWPSVSRLLLSFAFQDLDEKFGQEKSGQDLRKKLKPYFKELFEIYQKPICAMVCGVCRSCQKANFTGNSYLSPTTGISYDKKATEHLFQQF
jgi:uncharacterized protein